MKINGISNTLQIKQSFGSKAESDNKKEALKLKASVALTSALGVAATVAAISKRQGFSLSPKKIANTKIKDWAIFKIPNKNKPSEKVLTFHWYDIMAMGAGSVAGGLIGGRIFDKKENFPAKCSEAVSQLLGDIAVPLSFVAVPTMIYKKFEDLAHGTTKHVKLQNVSKYIQGNKFLKILCPVLVSGSSLVAGIIAGNRVSNKLNEHVHGVKQERKIRLTDFAPHLDDVCLAITLMAEKSPFGSIVSKFVPVALMVAGIETGSANDENRKD